ncbi:MAG: AbrB/MazE/SpoVT family DNA-binding domain-containing protein [bacterium]
MKKKPSILGLVKVNDKGQVVIPIEVRSLIDVKAGDKLMVMIHPSHEGIVLIKPVSLESFAKKMLATVSDAKLSYSAKGNNYG